MTLPTAPPTATPPRPNVAPPTIAQITIARYENSLRYIVPYCEQGGNEPPGRYSNLKGGPDLATTKLRYSACFSSVMLAQCSS